MKLFVTIEESKKYFDTNIAPCSGVATKLVKWDKLSKTTVLTKYIGAEHNDINHHIANRESQADLEESSGSDEILINWLDSNNCTLIVRDFALDKPVNKNISDGDFLTLEGELFYLIRPNDSKASLKISIAKSWAFLGFIVNNLTDDLTFESLKGMVMGIHKLDSFLIVD